MDHLGTHNLSSNSPLNWKRVELVHLLTGVSFINLHHNVVKGPIVLSGEDTFSPIRNFRVTLL